eukprot:UN24181
MAKNIDLIFSTLKSSKNMNLIFLHGHKNLKNHGFNFSSSKNIDLFLKLRKYVFNFCKLKNLK